MPCSPCVLELHNECYNYHTICNCWANSRSASISSDSENKRGGPAKQDEEVTDPKSTGRKRAAVLYPIEEGMVCEWAGLKFAGGGEHPIIGCNGNLVASRHHGPNKDTLRNEPGNVHRICHHCHNRWHAANDPAYNWDGPFKPHDPETRATIEEITLNEIKWSMKKLKRMDDDGIELRTVEGEQAVGNHEHFPEKGDSQVSIDGEG